MRVFSMAASSAASERSFSTFGFIHTKLWMDLFDHDSDCSSIDSMDVSRLEDVTA
jgi:hypothetical protein